MDTGQWIETAITVITINIGFTIGYIKVMREIDKMIEFWIKGNGKRRDLYR